MNLSKWPWLLVAGILLAVLFTLRAAPGLSEDAAREKIKQGAVVVDVRTVEEFQAGHLPNVVNIPLDEVREKFPAKFPDPSKTFLLHCRSGRRSVIAEKELRALGYTNVFNLGSYDRAGKILGSK